MKNTYFTSYFPLITILIFSTSLSLSTITVVIEYLQALGLYAGMLEFFSSNGIKLSLFILFALIYFMIFSAFKLIGDTVAELSLLFFSKDTAGENLAKIRGGSSYYLVAGIVSIALVSHPLWIMGVFILGTICYFVYFVYRISGTLSVASLIGLVLFHVLFWFTFIVCTFYILIKLYNSLLASLPI